MRSPQGAGRRRTAALLLGVVLVACAATPSAEHREELLGAVPESVLGRGVSVWTGGLEAGFVSVLPPRAVRDLLGVRPDAVEAVAESGGTPFTVLLADVRPTTVEEAAAAAGYELASMGPWTVLRRADGGNGPLGSAVPAAAARRGMVVIGRPADVAAVVDGDPSAASVPWVAALLDGTGEGDVILAPELARLEESAGEGGGAEAVLDRAGARGVLPHWEGWAVERDEGGEGAILLKLPAGEADAAAATALALRAATGPVLGSGRRAADVVEGGAPRFSAPDGTVRLPVRWLVDAATLRRDVERGALAFLLPGRSG